MARCFLLLFMLGSLFQSHAQPTIIAHRGASFDAPENTVVAQKLAWDKQSDAVELDIFLTRDGKVVVIHDGNTKRTTGVDLNVSGSTAAELQALDAGSFKGEQYKGERIPLLNEMLAALPKGKMLVVEIKCGVEVLPALKEVTFASGKLQQCSFISFNWDVVVAAKKLFPNSRCYWLSSVRNSLETKMDEAVTQGLDGFDLHYRAIDAEIINAANRRGLKIIAWTVDDPTEIKRLAALGVEGITTNRPSLVREILSQ